jgi:hypothetical protein
MTTYFINEATGRKYKILSFDKEKGEVRLLGDLGIASGNLDGFPVKYDKESFVKMGYSLKQIEETD